MGAFNAHTHTHTHTASKAEADPIPRLQASNLYWNICFRAPKATKTCWGSAVRTPMVIWKLWALPATALNKMQIRYTRKSFLCIDLVVFVEVEVYEVLGMLDSEANARDSMKFQALNSGREE